MDALPRFSDAEMARRRAALEAAMAEREAAHAVLYGSQRVGAGVGWLTRWPVTREALVLITPGEPLLLLVNFYNHVPNARRIATEAEVRWAGERAMATALTELRRRGGAGARVGVMGPLGHRPFAALAEVAEPVDMDADLTRMRLVKSPEEVAWTRRGAEMTDDAVRALRAHAVPGASELELVAAIEAAYIARGGLTHIHYLAATPMAEPDACVPAQYPSARVLARGDALVCEVSAAYWEYTGQLLRTFTVEAEPTPLFAELHAVAEAAFAAVSGRLRAGATAAELVAAGEVITEAGFTIRDDLVHGFVGGYLPPVLGISARALTPVPDFTFAAGMMVVVQPNVVTRDERAGVQTGELVLVTDTGFERLHAYPRGLLSAPG